LIVRLLTRTAVLLASATVTVGLVPAATAAPRALDAPSSRVVSAFPSDASTVPDPAQLTGRRVNLPLPDCGVRPTDCNTVRLLNQLDGFDLDPRLAVTFDRAVDPAAVAAGMRVTPVGGSSGTGVDRLSTTPPPILATRIRSGNSLRARRTGSLSTLLTRATRTAGTVRRRSPRYRPPMV